MWQFTEAIAGLVDGCKALGTPVTGGNVSFYNQTGSVAILPTPVVGVLGVIDDVTTRTPIGFAAEGDVIMLLGETRDELAGSVWADVVHDHLGGRPPVVDFDHEQRLAEVLITAARRGYLTSAHDLADGGLAQAVVESSLRKGFGAEISLPAEADPFVTLFSESAGRVLVSLSGDKVAQLTEQAAAHDIALTQIGRVTSDRDATIEITGRFSLSLADLRAAWRAPIREALGVA
jgi:phosphoribosylformylglycinamidine synthase